MSNREAIFWTGPGSYSQRDREIVRFENGKRIVEKVPQRGHRGDSDPDGRVLDSRAAANRWMHVCTDAGNWIRMVLTNAAAHTDITTEWAQERRAKAAHFGWFRIDACPLALVAHGELLRGQFLVQSMFSDRPCDRGTYSEAQPCKHCLAETDARRAAKAEFERERDSSYKDPTERQIEANAAAVREQTAAITAALAAAAGAGKKERDPK